MNKYYEVVKKIIIKIDPSVENSIKDGNTKIVDDLGFDSISLMTLLVEIEKYYNITFDNEVILLENLESINSLVKILKKIDPNS